MMKHSFRNVKRTKTVVYIETIFIIQIMTLIQSQYGFKNSSLY